MLPGLWRHLGLGVAELDHASAEGCRDEKACETAETTKPRSGRGSDFAGSWRSVVEIIGYFITGRKSVVSQFEIGIR